MTQGRIARSIVVATGSATSTMSAQGVLGDDIVLSAKQQLGRRASIDSALTKHAAFADVNDGERTVPTSRNVDKQLKSGFVKTSMNNGYFKTLEGSISIRVPANAQRRPRHRIGGRGARPAKVKASNGEP